MTSNNQNKDWLDILLENCFRKLSPIHATIALIALVVIDLKQPNFFPFEVNPSAQSRIQQYNGRAEYERLEIGMSQFEAEAILGQGIEIESSSDSTTFNWKNPDSSKITAVFDRNKKLQRKYQENLE